MVDGWKCAVKEFDISNINEKNMETYENELQALERLAYHKNIEKIFFHIKTQNTMRIFVTKYKNNLTSYLNDLSFQNKNLSPSKIVKLSLDVAKALSFLHEQNIFHREVISDNIYVNLNSEDDISFLSLGEFDRTKTFIETSQGKKKKFFLFYYELFFH